MLYNNRVAIGGFDVSGSDPAGWYGSSTEEINDYGAWAQHFSNRDQVWYTKDIASSLRLVR